MNENLAKQGKNKNAAKVLLLHLLEPAGSLLQGSNPKKLKNPSKYWSQGKTAKPNLS
ncbi:MAG: hypothetical protein ABIP51_00990 [Bacteroidia bacterium]